jgi:hypothetical protein
MFRDADVSSPQRSLKLSTGLKQIEGRPNRPGARRIASGFVVLTPQPSAKPRAANGPGFSVPIDHEIRKGGAAGGVKQLCIAPEVGEHIGGH